jgi:ribosome-interacting GTPase 1
MPANLTPQYRQAEEQYRRATTDAEKLEALREMQRTIPKHKGTEKLQADIKKKIAQLRSGGGKKKGARRAATHTVERSGAAQIMVFGPPNSGKSRLVRDFTSAEPEVAEYPFTTRTPTPGIARIEKIPLQLVDLPPATPDYIEPWLTDLLRNSDLVLVMLDLGADEILEHWEGLEAVLDHCRVSIRPPPPEEERDVGIRYQPSLIAGNRADLPGAADRLDILRELTGKLPILTCSLETGHGVREVFAEIIRILDVIRVYTKAPGQEADLEEPYVLPRGSTVEDAARGVHKDLAEHLKFARAWGERFHDGQPVGRDVELADGDILEFHE